MFARLATLVGSGSSLPFELGEPYSSCWGAWTHYKGTARADGSPVSVFKISAVNKLDPKLVAARNGVKRLKMLRHPNILTFKDTAEVEEKGETVIYLMTEAVSPLAHVLRDIRGPEREQYMAMGVLQIVNAVSFLNNDCKLVHGNVCMSSVVATEQLDWKLHAFDLLSEHQWAGSELPLMAASWAVPPQYKPGEVAKSEWQVVRESPPWAVDAWGLGCLVQELYSGAPLARTEDLRNTDSIPKDVLQYYQRLLASLPARRLNPSKIAESGVLRNRLVETLSFLDNLALKEANEKDAFFRKLPSLLPSVPRLVAQRKLLPMLAGALEFGGAPPVALNTLLQIGDTLEKEDYAKQVVPAIAKLFTSNDRGLRRSLLEQISSFGPALPDTLVEEQIYNHVSTGFGDANAYLRELTLKSMAVLGPKLSQRTINQSLLKHLAKMQVDEEPSIRANTTVLLGNLAGQLSEATCKKVLLNAFTRATKDAFPPSRVAGLKAIVSTAKYHSADDAAHRILPTVGPLAVDPVHEVRASALQCIDFFVKVLKDNNAVLERKAQQAAEAGDASAAAGAAGGSSLLTSFGWAVSSLGLGGGSSSSKKEDVPAMPAAAPAPTAAAPAQAAHAASRGGLGLDSPRSGGGSAAGAGAASAANDGWAGDDGLDDLMDDLNTEMEARKRLSRMTVGSSSSSSSRPAAVAAAAPQSRSGWEGEDEGWEGMETKPAVQPRAAPRRPLGARRTAGGQAGGMKLGASKLGASKIEKEEEW